jgi:nicotinamide mononucleotide (NMN) deamidase PncC
MAQAVRTQFHATFGLGVTGVPGPGERAGKPVGLAYFAIASVETVHTQEMRVAPRRITVKRRVSNAALIELSKLLRGDLRAHIEAHW